MSMTAARPLWPTLVRRVIARGDGADDDDYLTGCWTRLTTLTSMALRMWIGEILIPDSIEAKLRTRRGMTGMQVRGACVPDGYESARWENHPEHGMRLLVLARHEDGRKLKVILEPVDLDLGVWRLRTVLVTMRR